MAWDSVLLLEGGRNGEGDGRKEGEGSSKNSKDSKEQENSPHYSLGMTYSFGEFHQTDSQPFFGIKLDIRRYLLLLGIQFLFTILNFYFGLQRLN